MNRHQSTITIRLLVSTIPFIMLLFTDLVAQNIQPFLALQAGISSPNGAFNQKNIVKTGFYNGLDLGIRTPVNNRFSFYFATGITFSSLKKNEKRIAPDCIDAPFTTYLSNKDSLNGRGLKFREIPFRLGLQFRIGESGLFLKAGAGLLWTFATQIENFTIAECLKKHNDYMDYKPGNGIKFNEMNLLTELSIVQEFKFLTSYVEVFHQYHLLSKIEVRNSFSLERQFRLRPTNWGVRFGKRF